MDKIIKLNTVKDYNDFLGIETPHPLVSVSDVGATSSIRRPSVQIQSFLGA